MKKLFIVICNVVLFYNVSFSESIFEKKFSVVSHRYSYLSIFDDVFESFNSKYIETLPTKLRWSIEYLDSISIDSEVSISVSNKNINDILNIIFKKMPVKFAYEYDSINNFINIYPSSLINDTSYEFNLIIPKFKVKKIKPSNAIFRLAKKISKLNKKNRFTGFTGIGSGIKTVDDSPKFLIEVRSKSVRYILNTITTTLPNYKSYYYRKGFFNILGFKKMIKNDK